MKKFTGVGVALVTPFTSSGDVDFAALEKLISHVTLGGVDYLVVMGTTAEAATLSAQEKADILAFCIDKNQEKLPIVYGIGGNNTAQVVDDITSANLYGVSALLSVTPYYNKPSQAGLLAHYNAVLDASSLPVILYNVPGRTGVNMTTDTTLKLAHSHPHKAVAIKDASGNLSQVAYILRDRPTDFAVISGDDNLTFPIIAMGGDGVISVSANAFASKMCRMTHSALSGCMSEASSLALELFEATDLLFAEGNPVGVKAALALKSVINNNLRLPLVSATEGLVEKLAAQIQKYDL